MRGVLLVAAASCAHQHQRAAGALRLHAADVAGSHRTELRAPAVALRVLLRSRLHVLAAQQLAGGVQCDVFSAAAELETKKRSVDRLHRATGGVATRADWDPGSG